MTKEGVTRWALIVSLILVILLAVILLYYFLVFSPDYNKVYEKKIDNGEIINPVLNKTVEKAVEVFNESFIYYVLVQIKAYNLHNPSLSSDTPKIEFYVDSDVYNVVVDKGAITVSEGFISGPDVRIRTTKTEAVKMVQDSTYISKSFNDGKSSFEQIAGVVTLASKGYINLYKELTGNSITGSVIKIYVGG